MVNRVRITRGLTCGDIANCGYRTGGVLKSGLSQGPLPDPHKRMRRQMRLGYMGYMLKVVAL